MSTSTPTTLSATFDEPRAGAPTMAPLLGARIMLVDDDMMMTEVVQTYLEDAGYRHFTVTNEPREALGLLRSQDVGVLLLDWMMPGLSGEEVLKQIRAEPELRFLPVIILTAAVGSDTKVRALELGATDFLAKPIDPSELLLRVRNTLAFRQFHEQSANVDALTGLSTRRHFLQQATRRMQTSAGGDAAALCLGVPGLRRAGELFGQGTSDALAVEVSHRLQAAAQAVHGGPEVVLGRLHSDEFALFLEGEGSTERLEPLAQELMHVLSRAVQIDGQQHALEPRAGLAWRSDPGQGARSLLEQAELARRHAAEGPPQTVAAYSDGLSGELARRHANAQALSEAWRLERLRPQYQPIVDMNSGDIAGIEAVLHWAHPEEGMLVFEEFADLADNLGLADRLAAYTMQQACLAAARWRAAGLSFGQVSVDVHPSQLTGGQLLATVDAALAASGLPGNCLALEFSEGLAGAAYASLRAIVGELQARGVALVLDRFGARGIAFEQVRDLPVSRIKIPAAFVQGVSQPSADRAIVAATIVLAHHLDMKVVAMGVDDTEALFALHELACDMQQGTLYSAPLDEDEVMALLRQAS